jgi:hypothetical protein
LNTDFARYSVEKAGSLRADLARAESLLRRRGAGGAEDQHVRVLRQYLTDRDLRNLFGEGWEEMLATKLRQGRGGVSSAEIVDQVVVKMWELESDESRRRYTALAEKNAKINQNLGTSANSMPAQAQRNGGGGAAWRGGREDQAASQADVSEQPDAFPDATEGETESGDSGDGGGHGGSSNTLTFAERRELNRASLSR